MRIGIDFGTTNSAVAVRQPDGRPRIVELFPGERVQRTVIHASLDGPIRFGNAAFRAYVEEDLTGRFLRSLKAFLPADVPRTSLGGRRYEFSELIAAYLGFLIERTEEVLGDKVTEVVIGRPVVFHADPEKNALAERRLAGAARDAGIGAFGFQLEPVAAAHLYELGLDGPRTVLVGDFGGGTSDFAVFRAGPDRVAVRDRRPDVLATTGVAQAGDALDAEFMNLFLVESFGRDAWMRQPYTDALVQWEHPIHRQILKLYSLHLVRSPELQRGLERIEPRMVDPVVVRRLRKLVFDDLGYPMAWAIERTKRELSAAEVAPFTFDEFHNPALNLSRDVRRADYAAGCADLLRSYSAAIDRAIALADTPIDDVFLTGGTSQLPFVRDLFVERFGADRIRGADAFTSVCEGLALSGELLDR
ncbi:MAG: Hsp70 family protein [Myxococcota bacterium]